MSTPIGITYATKLQASQPLRMLVGSLIFVVLYPGLLSSTSKSFDEATRATYGVVPIGCPLIETLAPVGSDVIITSSLLPFRRVAHPARTIVNSKAEVQIARVCMLLQLPVKLRMTPANIEQAR